MDQTKFDEAIRDYVVKQVDKDNDAIVQYKLLRRPRTTLIPVGAEQVRSFKTRPTKAIITPYGRFESVLEASAKLGFSPQLIYGRIAKSKLLNNKEYYYDGGDET